MKTTHFLIVVGLLAILLLTACGARADPLPIAPGAQIRDLIGMNAREYQPAGSYVFQLLSIKSEIKTTLLVKLLVAAIVLLPTLIILVIALVVRRIRRRSFSSTGSTTERQGGSK